MKRLARSLRSSTPEPGGAAVSLDQMLERREARVASQRTWLARFRRPVVSLTLVAPGPIKDTAQSRFVFERGLAAIEAALATGGYRILAGEQAFFVTGPEALRAVDADAVMLKCALVAVEEQHPLGRLWDADVIAPEGHSISRRHLDLPARRCLLCDLPGHACARSGAHPLADLQQAIKDRIDAYRSRTAL